MGIGTVAAQFLSWEYLFRIFVIVSLQCVCQGMSGYENVGACIGIKILKIIKNKKMPSS